MGNTGKPSRNCHLCRARRVKCDLTRPSCRRCSIYGASCPGYREEADLMFRNHNPEDFRSMQLQHKSSKLQAYRGRLKGTSNPTIEVRASELMDAGTPSISRPISAAHPHSSFALILHEFTSPERQYEPAPLGLLNVLPDLYRESEPQSCLPAVIDAFAHAYMCNKTKVMDSDRILARRYGKALALTNQALTRPADCLHDGTIMAVWLLGVYELQVGMSFRAPAAYNAHAQGLMSLIRARGVGQLLSRQGRNAFWLSFIMILQQSLVANVPCPQDCRYWLDQVRLGQSDMDATLCDVYTYLVDGTELILKIDDAIRCKGRDLQFDDFHGFWQVYDMLENRVVSIYHEPCNPEGQSFGNLYRSTRAKLHQAMINLADLIKGSVVASSELALIHQCQTRSASVISLMVEGIMETLDWERSSCWADAMRIMTPLNVVVSLPNVPIQRRYHAIIFIKQMAEDVGIVQGIGDYLNAVKQIPDKALLRM